MWTSSVGANLLLVANDEVSTNDFRQGLMDMAAPSFAQTRYFSIEKTINIIHKASDSQHIAIICETPQDVVKLVEGGVPIKKVNIGNMHMAEGKRQISKAVSGQAIGDTLTKVLPEWVWTGLRTAGGMMPALGFVILLKVMLSK